MICLGFAIATSLSVIVVKNIGILFGSIFCLFLILLSISNNYGSMLQLLMIEVAVRNALVIEFLGDEVVEEGL
jgi:hypothetical protein